MRPKTGEWLRRVAVAAVGAVLLGLLGGWALLAQPSAPESTAWATACALAAGGLFLGVLLGRLDAAVPALAALAVAVGAVVVTLPESLSGEPLAPPLGYMNANGALLLGGAAGAVVATWPRGEGWRFAASATAFALGVVCVVDGAQAAAAACLLLAAWVPLRGRGPGWVWTTVGGVSVALPVVLTVGWAAEVLPRPAALVSALSDERFRLWQESWQLLRENPLSGIGPGRFSLESPTAADPDLAWAHSAVLQAGAELGWVAVALLLAVLVWGVGALGRDSLLLGVLLLPASVDYVLHFGGVLLVSSLVVGAALSVPRASRSTRSSPGRGKP